MPSNAVPRSLPNAVSVLQTEGFFFCLPRQAEGSGIVTSSSRLCPSVQPGCWTVRTMPQIEVMRDVVYPMAAGTK